MNGRKGDPPRRLSMYEASKRRNEDEIYSSTVRQVNARRAISSTISHCTKVVPTYSMCDAFHLLLFFHSILILLSMLRCCRTPTRLLAAMLPEAAVAGIPMPGKTESPHKSNPGRGVLAGG